jgi:hypothetical protein
VGHFPEAWAWNRSDQPVRNRIPNLRSVTGYNVFATLFVGCWVLHVYIWASSQWGLEGYTCPSYGVSTNLTIISRLLLLSSRGCQDSRVDRYE